MGTSQGTPRITSSRPKLEERLGVEAPGPSLDSDLGLHTMTVHFCCFKPPWLW